MLFFKCLHLLLRYNGEKRILLFGSVFKLPFLFYAVTRSSYKIFYFSDHFFKFIGSVTVLNITIVLCEINMLIKLQEIKDKILQYISIILTGTIYIIQYSSTVK